MAHPASSDSTSSRSDAVVVKHLLSLYELLNANVPTSKGKELSADERDKRGMRAATLVYGEIMFEPFAHALLKIKHLYGGLATPGGKFYDLGSGTGKPVFAAALLHAWDSCTGIEMLEGLHDAANKLLTDVWLSDGFHKKLPESSQGVSIHFVHGDATLYDWADATVIFANSTCFDETLMKQLAAASENMAVGSFAITFTKRIPSHKWKVLESNVEMMSWGAATVFIQTKVT